MSAQEFMSTISQVAYLALFLIVAARLIHRPSTAAVDTFLFFGVIAVLLIAADVVSWLDLEATEVLGVINWVGISALPYVLLRLADDFRPQPVPLMVGATVAFAAVAIVGILAPQPRGPLISLLPVGYVVILGVYASYAFSREAFTTTGVTHRRMQAVALGSGLLAAILLLAGIAVVWPEARPVTSVVSQVLSLLVVVSYFLGFAPPSILRRAWQEPALRQMLAEAAELVRLPDRWAVADRLEQRAQAVTGAEGARVGFWDESSGLITFRDHPIGIIEMKPGEYVSGRAFIDQRPFATGWAERDAPEHANVYRERGIQALVSAPITSDEARIGVLTVFAARPPAFTDDVVSLVVLLAEQAALVLRSQQLLQEAAQVRALAEVTRLKDDFLSVVAHDVRTPLTTILLNAELLEQSVEKDSTSARRAASLRTEALRLKGLVEDYLDVVRAEQDRELHREPHDLVDIVQETLAGMGDASARVQVQADGSVIGAFDARRVGQLVQNLVSNAMKYSDPVSSVEVDVRGEGDDAVLVVRDHGIGIPEADLPLLFERFHRGSNADDRRYGGLGLGLHICRQIAREHGGDVTVSSRMGEGSVFTARLARAPRRADATTEPVR